MDLLDMNRPQQHLTNPGLGRSGMTTAMAWQVQQNLPKAQLPEFDGSALKWVEFITMFRDVVHNQEYHDTRRHIYSTGQLFGLDERVV